MSEIKPNMPLAGIRVLDLSRVLAGPFCGSLLANLGAEVVKIEDLKGDETRQWRPFVKDMSSPFASMNFNKKSIALNLKDKKGIEIFKKMIPHADVIIENFKTGTMEKFGLGYDVLKQINPRLIYIGIGAFGRIGPRSAQPGYETLIQAFSGIMSYTGEASGMPARSGVSFLDLSSGVFATLAVLVALYQRQQSNEGCKVEGSLLQSAIAMMTVQLTPFLMCEEQPKKLGSAHQSITPYQAYPTKDGWVLIAAANQNLWEKLCQALSLPHLITDQRFQDNPHRMQNIQALTVLLTQALANWTAESAVLHLVKAGVPCSKINDFKDLTNDPQFHALQQTAINTVHDDEYGEMQTPGLPFTMKGFQADETTRPPKLGEHTTEVLNALGYDASEIAEMKGGGVVG